MSKKKGIPLHEWQEKARIESVRFDLGPWGQSLVDNVTTYFDKPLTIFVNEPARAALQPYLDDSGKTPDAS